MVEQRKIRVWKKMMFEKFFCGSCGRRGTLPEGQVFCSYCGSRDIFDDSSGSLFPEEVEEGGEDV